MSSSTPSAVVLFLKVTVIPTCFFFFCNCDNCLYHLPFVVIFSFNMLISDLLIFFFFLLDIIYIHLGLFFTLADVYTREMTCDLYVVFGECAGQ